MAIFNCYVSSPGSYPAFLCCPLGEIKYITSGTAGSLVVTETADEDEPPCQAEHLGHKLGQFFRTKPLIKLVVTLWQSNIAIGNDHL